MVFLLYCQYIFLEKCYTFPTMKKKTRLIRGDRNFQNFIIPNLKDDFPGLWQSTNGTLADMKHGIDFYYTHGQTTLSISARVWTCEPKQHFAVRWKKTSNPQQLLEVGSRLKALRNDLPMSNLTIEGFVYNRWVYIAWVDTRVLWEAVEVNLDNLRHFPVKNQEGGYTLFLQVPFKLFPEEVLFKKVCSII